MPLEYIFPLSLLWRIHIMLAFLQWCYAVCSQTYALLWYVVFSYQGKWVQFIYEQSILTSLAASGALVTMESRHHTLHAPPRKKKKTFWLKATPSSTTTPLCEAVAEGRSAYIYKTGSELILRHFGLLEVGRPGGGGLLFPSEVLPRN